MLDPQFPPRAKRHKVLLFATVERFGTVVTTEHRVRDLSVSGACVDQGESFRVGETLVVTVGTLVAIGAQVVWVQASLAGLRFNEPIEIDAALSKAILPPKAFRVRNPLRRLS